MIYSALTAFLENYTAHKNSVQANAEERRIILCQLVLPLIVENLKKLSEVVENPSSYDLAKAFLGGVTINENPNPNHPPRNYKPFPNFVFPRKN